MLGKALCLRNKSWRISGPQEPVWCFALLRCTLGKGKQAQFWVMEMVPVDRMSSCKAQAPLHWVWHQVRNKPRFATVVLWWSAARAVVDKLPVYADCFWLRHMGAWLWCLVFTFSCWICCSGMISLEGVSFPLLSVMLTDPWDGTAEASRRRCYCSWSAGFIGEEKGCDFPSLPSLGDSSEVGVQGWISLLCIWSKP